MNRIWSLAALVALLGLGTLLTFTHSESAGQTQPPAKNADTQAEQIKKLERQNKILEELSQNLQSEIAVLKRLPQVTAKPDERAKLIAELRARLEKIDRDLGELGPGPDREAKEKDGEPAKKEGKPEPKKDPQEIMRRIQALEAERESTVNALYAALAAGPMPGARRQNAATMAMLQEAIDTRGLQEKVKMKTALEFISNRFHGMLVVLIDKEAFVTEQGADAPDPYEEEVALPPFPTKIPLNVALRLLISQAGKGEATYQIRQGYIEITTLKNATAANGLAGSLAPCSFDMRPLSEVLETLTAETGLDINVDPSVGKKGAALIKATFRNTTLEEALVTATEMAELKYVVLDRTVYVTTPEKAEVLRKEQKERDQRREKVRPANPDPRKRAESAP